MSLADQRLRVSERSIGLVDVDVIGDVVAVVSQGRGVKGQQPDGRYAQVGQVVELFRQTGKIADAVAVAVAKGADMNFVDDGIAIPVGSALQP